MRVGASIRFIICWAQWKRENREHLVQKLRTSNGDRKALKQVQGPPSEHGALCDCTGWTSVKLVPVEASVLGGSKEMVTLPRLSLRT